MKNVADNDGLAGLIPFPCCPQEKVFVYGNSKGKVSTRCPRCRKFVMFDYGSMTAKMAPPLRGAMNQHKYIRAYID